MSEDMWLERSEDLYLHALFDEQSPWDHTPERNKACAPPASLSPNKPTKSMQIQSPASPATPPNSHEASDPLEAKAQEAAISGTCQAVSTTPKTPEVVDEPLDTNGSSAVTPVSGSVFPIVSPAAVVICPFAATLEDIFHGTAQQVSVPHNTTNTQGVESHETYQFRVPIKAGMRAGSLIVPQQSYARAALAVYAFVLEEKPHPAFQREGADLIADMVVNHSAFNIGWKETIQGIDGQVLTITGAMVRLAPQLIFPGHGMPLAGSPEHRGDLIINVVVP